MSPEIDWENPNVGPGFPNAVVFGFDIYGGTTEGNTVRLTGPEASTPLLATAVPGFQLNAGVFHRVIITAVSNGPASTVFSLQIINDVNGAATALNLINNVVVPGFDITTDTFRLIAGGRTGGSTVKPFSGLASRLDRPRPKLLPARLPGSSSVRVDGG